MSAYIDGKKIQVGVRIDTDRVVLSKEEYDSLEVKDTNTMYMVYDDPTIEELCEHVDDTTIHVTTEEKEQFLNAGHTDEEINDLIESGLSGYLKKELISSVAVDLTNTTTTEKYTPLTIPYSNLVGCVGLLLEFDGTISHYSQYNPSTNSTQTISVIQVGGSKYYDASAMWDLSRKTSFYNTYSYTNKKFIYYLPLVRIVNNPNSAENVIYYFNMLGTTSASAFSSDATYNILAYAKNTTVTAKGTFNAYALYL